MSSRTLYRLSGISLLIGSLFLIAGNIPFIFLGSDEITPVTSASGIAIRVFSDLLILIGAMLIVSGFSGIYARFAGRSGIVGLIGFTCTFFFFLIMIASLPIFALVVPSLAARGLLNGVPLPLSLFILEGLGLLLGLVGGILLGIAVLRATVLPRWTGVLLIIGSLLNLGIFLEFDPLAHVGGLLFAAGLALLVIGMWSKQPTTVEASLAPTEVRA